MTDEPEPITLQELEHIAHGELEAAELATVSMPSLSVEFDVASVLSVMVDVLGLGPVEAITRLLSLLGDVKDIVDA